MLTWICLNRIITWEKLIKSSVTSAPWSQNTLWEALSVQTTWREGAEAAEWVTTLCCLHSRSGDRGDPEENFTVIICERTGKFLKCLRCTSIRSILKGCTVLKLFCCPCVRLFIALLRLPEDKSMNKECPGWDGSLEMVGVLFKREATPVSVERVLL